MHKRVRIDYNDKYFTKAYRLESQLLEAYIKLVKNIVDEQIDDQRCYIQKLYRDNIRRFGIPLKVIPIQNIAIQTNKSVVKPVYMLEFHPSLALIGSIDDAIRKSLDELMHMYQPKTTLEKLELEMLLLETLQTLWKKKNSLTKSYSLQTERDIFSDLFVEDPIFVCEVGRSTSPSSSSSSSLKCKWFSTNCFFKPSKSLLELSGYFAEEKYSSQSFAFYPKPQQIKL